MCNRIHNGNKEFPIEREEGEAWKVFLKIDNKLIPPFELSSRNYNTDTNGWIRWKDEYCPDEGFCLFAEEEQARFWFDKMKNTYYFGIKRDCREYLVLRKVEYRHCKAYREESSLPWGHWEREDIPKVFIVKEFRPILEGEEI